MAEVRATDKRQEGQVIGRYRTMSTDTEGEAESEGEAEPEEKNLRGYRRRALRAPL